MYNIHKKITAVRRKRQLSQPQASFIVNIPIRTYQRIESGQTSVSLDYLNRIADGFQCSVDDILHFDLEMNEFFSENKQEQVQKIQNLENENSRLQQLVNWLTMELMGKQTPGFR